LKSRFPRRHRFLQGEIGQTAIPQPNRRYPGRALPIKIEQTLRAKISESHFSWAILEHETSIGRIGRNFSPVNTGKNDRA
jgi:hypothetical protein